MVDLAETIEALEDELTEAKYRVQVLETALGRLRELPSEGEHVGLPPPADGGEIVWPAAPPMPAAEDLEHIQQHYTPRPPAEPIAYDLPAPAKSPYDRRDSIRSNDVQRIEDRDTRAAAIPEAPAPELTVGRRGRPVRYSHDLVRELHGKGMIDQEIADALGGDVSRQVARKIRRELDLPPNGKRGGGRTTGALMRRANPKPVELTRDFTEDAGPVSGPDSLDQVELVDSMAPVVRFLQSRGCELKTGASFGTWTIGRNVYDASGLLKVANRHRLEMKRPAFKLRG